MVWPFTRVQPQHKLPFDDSLIVFRRHNETKAISNKKNRKAEVKVLASWTRKRQLLVIKWLLWVFVLPNLERNHGACREKVLYFKKKEVENTLRLWSPLKCFLQFYSWSMLLTSGKVKLNFSPKLFMVAGFSVAVTSTLITQIKIIHHRLLFSSGLFSINLFHFPNMRLDSKL